MTKHVNAFPCMASQSEDKLWTVPVLYGTPSSATTPKLELMETKTFKLKVRKLDGYRAKECLRLMCACWVCL